MKVETTLTTQVGEMSVKTRDGDTKTLIAALVEVKTIRGKHEPMSTKPRFASGAAIKISNEDKWYRLATFHPKSSQVPPARTPLVLKELTAPGPESKKVSDWISLMTDKAYELWQENQHNTVGWFDS